MLYIYNIGEKLHKELVARFSHTSVAEIHASEHEGAESCTLV